MSALQPETVNTVLALLSTEEARIYMLPVGADHRADDLDGVRRCIADVEDHEADESTGLVITPDAAYAIAKYTDAYEEMCLADELRERERENLRSYACEALVRILRANPETFDFVARMEAVRARKTPK